MPRKRQPTVGDRIRARVLVLTDAGAAELRGTVEAVNPEPMGCARELLVHWEDGALSWIESQDVELASTEEESR